MSGAPVEPQAFIDALVRAVDLRLDQRLLCRDFPMVAPEAEGVVLTEVLAQRVTHDDLPPLAGEHFSVAMYGAAFEAMRETLTPDGIARELLRRGYADGSMVVAELWPVASEPHPSVCQVAAMADHIIDLSRRRRWVGALRRSASLVEVGALGVEESAAELRTAYREARR